MDVDTSLSIVATYNLFLSSANRSEGSPQNFSVSLIKAISLSNPNNWMTVRVGSAEIPYNFKLLNATNNTINFRIVRNAITYTSSITIESGNYNILSLLSEFKSKLSASILGLTGWDASTRLNFTYNRNTGKATFSFIPNDSIATTISILNASTVFLRCIGFTSYPVFSYSSPASITPAISNQNVNVSQNTALYIRSETLTQTSNFENVVGASEYSDILAKVQINVQPGSIIQWVNATDLEIDLANKIIDRINLYLGDSQSYEVDMGGLDWTCRLTIQEWSFKSQSQADDKAIELSRIDPTVYNDLMKTREKAMKRLTKLKNRLPLEDAEKSQEIQKETKIISDSNG
jgi:hypothetical protein